MMVVWVRKAEAYVFVVEDVAEWAMELVWWELLVTLRWVWMVFGWMAFEWSVVRDDP